MALINYHDMSITPSRQAQLIPEATKVALIHGTLTRKVVQSLGGRSVTDI